MGGFLSSLPFVCVNTLGACLIYWPLVIHTILVYHFLTLFSCFLCTLSFSSYLYSLLMFGLFYTPFMENRDGLRALESHFEPWLLFFVGVYVRACTAEI